MNNDLSEGILKKELLSDGSILVLKRPEEEDAKDLMDYFNSISGQNNRFSGQDEYEISETKVLEFIKKSKLELNSLIIIGFIKDEIVCFAQINNPSDTKIEHNCKLSISVKQEYWSVGIGSVVTDELLKFGREHDMISNIVLDLKPVTKRLKIEQEEY